MDKLLRRALAAERIRRQTKTAAEALERHRSEQRAFDRGHNAGRHVGSPLPADFMGHLMSRVASRLAIEIAEKVSAEGKRDLAHMALKIVERIMATRSWAMMDEAAMAHWIEEETLELRLQFKIPAMTWNESLDRRMIDQARKWR